MIRFVFIRLLRAFITILAVVTFAFVAGEVKRSSGLGRMRSTSETVVWVSRLTSIGPVRMRSFGLNLLSGPRTNPRVIPCTLC